MRTVEELAKAAEAALAAMETPGDLTPGERTQVIKDLDWALNPFRSPDKQSAGYTNPYPAVELMLTQEHKDRFAAAPVKGDLLMEAWLWGMPVAVMGAVRGRLPDGKHSITPLWLAVEDWMPLRGPDGAPRNPPKKEKK